MSLDLEDVIDGIKRTGLPRVVKTGLEAFWVCGPRFA